VNAATVADERVQAEMARIRALPPQQRADAVVALLDDASMFAVLAAKYREPQ